MWESVAVGGGSGGATSGRGDERARALLAGPTAEPSEEEADEVAAELYPAGEAAQKAARQPALTDAAAAPLVDPTEEGAKAAECAPKEPEADKKPEDNDELEQYTKAKKMKMNFTIFLMVNTQSVLMLEKIWKKLVL